jgi:hypothetical protein
MNFAPGPGFEEGTAGGGRWYPTPLTLNSSRVLAFWGHPADDDRRHTNNTPEYFEPTTRSWHILGRESDVKSLGDFESFGYPRVYVLPNGRVFRATPVLPPGETRMFNVEINPILESLVDRNNIGVRVSQAPGERYGTDYSYTSVLLPLTPANRYGARVFLVGGPGAQPATLPQYSDLRMSIPRADESLTQQWRATSERELALARIHANATILPTGEIFVSGGRSGYGASLDEQKIVDGEIYDPFNDTWRTVAPAEVPREYHSVALLMPDGRVWHGGTSRNLGRGLEAQEDRIELYEPWYYTLTRPAILSMTGLEDRIYAGAPGMHPHGPVLTITATHFRDITKFVLVRAGSAMPTSAISSLNRCACSPVDCSSARAVAPLCSFSMLSHHPPRT